MREAILVLDPFSPSLVPFFVSVLVAELRSKGALGKSPTGLDRPTVEMPLLGSVLRESSLLKSFSFLDINQGNGSLALSLPASPSLLVALPCAQKGNPIPSKV